MNPKQLEMARHALGFPNKKNTSNRNHYCVGSGCDGHEEWMDLVSGGMAVRRTGPLWGGDDMFHLTLRGALMARGPKEHISREEAASMRRMEEYVKAIN